MLPKYNYSSLFLTVPVAEWLAYFPMICQPGFKLRWALFYFSKNNLTERSLKCAHHSVHWMVAEMQLKSTFPLTIQSTERWDFILWIPFIQGCFEPSLVEIGYVVFLRRFLNFLNVFLLFRNYSIFPLEKGGALLFNKLDSPSPKNTLC